MNNLIETPSRKLEFLKKRQGNAAKGNAIRLWLAVLLCGISSALHATSYTTSVAGDLNNKANWTPTPPNFTTQSDTWTITLPMTVATTWAVTGNVTIAKGGAIKDMGKTITFNGHFTNNTDSGFVATGTTIFGSEFPQAIGGSATTIFNNLSRTHNGLSFNANCAIKGDFEGKSFIVDGGNTIYFGGNFTVATGNNLFTGTAVFNGKNAQTIDGNPDFNNLTISNAKGVTLKTDEKVLGDLTINEGVLTDGGNAISVAKNILGAGKETGAGGITLTGSAATISGATLENLTLDNAAGFTLTGNTLITGALTFKAGSLVIGGNTLTLAGTVAGMNGSRFLTGSDASNITITATHDLGTLYFNQSNPGVSNNVATLTLSGKEGTVTLGNKLSISATLALTAGTLADGGNNITLMGSITGNGAATGAGGITMKGESATISAATIGKLELNHPSDFSLTGSPTITDALVMTAGTLTIGANTLTLNGAVSGMSAANFLTGSASSNLVIGNNGAVDVLFFDQSEDGVSNNIATLTVKGTGYSIVKLGNKLVSGKTVILTKGQLQINDQTFVINGGFTGTATDNIQGSLGSNLVINARGNSGPYFFDQTTPGRTNNIAKLTINSAGGTVNIGSALNVSNELALDSGALADGGNVITVIGNITGTGSATGTGGIVITGAAPAISGVTLNNLTIQVKNAATLSGNLTVNNVLTMASGKLSIGANTLTLNGSTEGMSGKNSLIGGPDANLTIGSKGAFGTIYLDQSAKGASNTLAALKLVNDNCTVTMAGNIVVGTMNEGGKKRKKRK